MLVFNTAKKNLGFPEKQSMLSRMAASTKLSTTFKEHLLDMHSTSGLSDHITWSCWERSCQTECWRSLNTVDTNTATFFPKLVLVFIFGWKNDWMFFTPYMYIRLWDLRSFSGAIRTDSQWMIPGCLCSKDRRMPHSHAVWHLNPSPRHFHYLVKILPRGIMLCCRPYLTGDTAPQVLNKAHQCNDLPFSRKLTMTAV